MREIRSSSGEGNKAKSPPVKPTKLEAAEGLPQGGTKPNPAMGTKSSAYNKALRPGIVMFL